MRFNRLFILGVLAFLAIVFVMEYRMPRKFQWVPTYDHRDRQPFGCYVFDSVLKTSIPQGYCVEKKTFYQLKEDNACKAILVVADGMPFTETDVSAILELADRGCNILLAGESLGLLEDTLHLENNFHYTSLSLIQYAQTGRSRDTLVWQQDSIYGEQSFTYYPQLLQRTISGPVDSLGYEVLCRNIQHNDAPTAVRIPIGKGALVWVSTPLVFTNYGILDGDNYLYIFRLLSQFGRQPIVRTEVYVQIVKESPLRYILSQQPLRWALYLALLTILLFMVFTARRRQRAIPSVKEPENMSLEFAKQIGTLYAQRKDYADAVIKKYTYFAEELRTLLHIDITDVTADHRNLHQLSFLTGMDEQQLAAIVDELRLLVADKRQITAEDMGRYIRAMNEIINQI